MPEVPDTVFSSATLLPEVRGNSWPTESVYPLRQHPFQLQHIRDDVEENLVGTRSADTLEGVLYSHDHCVYAGHDRGPTVCVDRKTKAKENTERRRPIGFRPQELTISRRVSHGTPAVRRDRVRLRNRTLRPL